MGDFSTKFILFIGMLINFPSISAQTVIDDFESDLNNWTVVEGNANLQGTNVFSGSMAIRLNRPESISGAETVILHNTFRQNFGVYEMACYADGPVSDIQFLFQYQDNQNYYAVASNPRATDNPYLLLWKVVNGQFTVLDSIDPVMDLNQWYKLRVERYCDGGIYIYVDDDLKIQVMDRALLDPGTIGLAAWAESTYFDELTFEPVNSNVVTELNEFICSGTFYEVGSNRYSQTNFYIDTLQTAEGCDSIVHLQLNVTPHYLSNDRDTVCFQDGYILGEDTLRTSGRYNKSLFSKYGCDSIVELSLVVVGESTYLDTLLCADQYILVGNDTIFDAGTYYDTISATQGCFSIAEINVRTKSSAEILGADQTVCFETTPNIPLSASGYDSVQWFDGRTNETIAISAPGVYSVEVFDGECKAIDSIEIFEFCEPQLTVYIPNAFSPNNDNVNDFFQPNYIQRPVSYQMRIFNRWGGLIFSTTNDGLGWDGRVNGKVEPTGVYLYLIEIDGEQYSGTVNLIR